MKTLEKWIQFGIDNGFREVNYIWYIYWHHLWHEWHDINEVFWQFVEWDSDDYTLSYTSIIDIITSKPFIEAIERWLEKTKDVFWVVVIDWDNMVEHYHFDHWDEEIYHCNDAENRKALTHDITTQQAIAIRDGTMEEFINTII